MTPLEKMIREMIAADGPMGLDRYMGLCLAHPEHGYYMGRDPFGARGDFLTAPEVSQVFGELIGVWCISAWAAMGQPSAFNLVELGPGRGTLMADVLRAIGALPQMAAAAQVHLVEASPALRAVQRARRLIRFLTQPFAVTSQFTGHGGASVGIEDTLAGCEAILDGKTDDWDEQQLYMIGTLQDAENKGKASG